MKVRIERRGGLTGALAVGERNVEDLSAPQRQALDRLVNTPPASPGPDHIHPLRYKITLTDKDGATRHFDVPEDAMPDDLASIPEVKL